MGVVIVNPYTEEVKSTGYNHMPAAAAGSFPWDKDAESELDKKYPYGELAIPAL